jgi:NTE family protein
MIVKVGVALGGGGVRGFAHVLALETIDACGLIPTALAGTSTGAIIGALYASGRSGKEIREVVEQHIITRSYGLKAIYRKKGNLLKWLSAVRPAWKGRGLLKADGFLQYLIEEIGISTFEELKIPLHVTATDFYRGEPVVFNTGELLPALRASMSIPGIFVPVEHNGKILVDGGVVNNLPYDLLVDKCDVTIAIDVAPTREVEEAKPPNIIDATLGMFDIMVDRVTECRIKERPPTIYVRPKLVGIRTLDFEKMEFVLEQAQPAMEEFKTKLEQVLKTR